MREWPDEAEVLSWLERPVHDPRFWLGAVDGAGKLQGCVIADLDHEAGELSLDWVQVHPSFRRRGLAAALVTEVLRRAVGVADFATVSGELDGEQQPDALYRRCGFTGEDVWHVYR